MHLVYLCVWCYLRFSFPWSGPETKIWVQIKRRGREGPGKGRDELEPLCATGTRVPGSGGVNPSALPTPERRPGA